MEAPEFLVKKTNVDRAENETPTPIRVTFFLDPNPEREEFSILLSLGLESIGTLLTLEQADQIGESLVSASQEFRDGHFHPIQNLNSGSFSHPETGEPAIFLQIETEGAIVRRYHLPAQQAVDIFEKLRDLAQSLLGSE